MVLKIKLEYDTDFRYIKVNNNYYNPHIYTTKINLLQLLKR